MLLILNELNVWYTMQKHITFHDLAQEVSIVVTCLSRVLEVPGYRASYPDGGILWFSFRNI
jgi:hypothetical protein